MSPPPSRNSLIQAYRMEDFVTAAQLYSALVQKSTLADKDDVAANLAASKAQVANLTGIPPAVASPDIRSHEMQFNVACELLSLGRFVEAEAALKRAESRLPWRVS
jgi:hypothetical protein